MKRKIFSVLGVALCGVLMAAGSIDSNAFDVQNGIAMVEVSEPISFTIDGRNSTTTTTTNTTTTKTTTTTTSGPKK